MFQERDGEREILLGNKQLLGIFFVLAILFCVFFTAGYMVGHSTGSKSPADTVAAAKPATPDSTEAQATAGETHAVTPDPPESTESASAAIPEKPSPAATTHVVAAPKTLAKSEVDSSSAEEQEQAHAEAEQPGAHGHHTYLQVTALKRSEALKVAKVLNRKGFHAQISPKAGTPLYRVLVGPVHNAGELNATRAALKNKGFREVFVQHL
jgi:cell division protein FtsN